MKKILLINIFLLSLTSGCNINSSAASSTSPLPSPSEITDPTPDQTLRYVPVEESIAQEDVVSNGFSIEVVGEPELVFDWSTDRCEEEHIPDIAARAFRDINNQVQLYIGHYVNYRMIGPDLNSLEPDCSGYIMNSAFDPDPSAFNDSEWLAAPYTEDGETIYAIVHNEYRGDTHNATRPGQCPSKDRLTCLDTSVTMAISTDGGDSYQDILTPPNHLVATMPYTFDDAGVPSGLRQPSNMVKGKDGYYYIFANASDYPENEGDFPPQWVCVMRTNDLSSPGSWRFWDGQGFNSQFQDPYINTEVQPNKCAPLELPDLGEGLQETITYNTALDRYIMVGVGYKTYPNWEYGYYYAVSDDLVHWTYRQELILLPILATAEDVYYSYPTVLDPDSPSRNFETSDATAYLYLTRFNNGYNSLDRDLIRYPIEITPPTYDVPKAWRFDTAGDTEGWIAPYHIDGFAAGSGTLSMFTTGEDAQLVSPKIQVPAQEYDQLWVRMRVSAGSPTAGEFFFITDADDEWDGEKYLLFDIPGDGNPHDYILDLSALPGWIGEITQFRLDPVVHPDRQVDIEIITFIE